MRFVKLHTLAACVLAVLVSGAGFGATKNINYIAPEARSVDGGRDVQIIVSQAEIQPNINISNMTAAAGGGLLFAMIDAGINNARAKEAEKQIVPLREALVGYDFDPLAQHASLMTLEALGWFDPRQVRLSKDEANGAVLAALDAATTPQLMVLRYSYETNADFSGVVVSLDAYLANKAVPAGKKPDARLQPKNLKYRQTLRSMVMLPLADPGNAEANLRRWTAQNARLARAAIDMGVARCQELLTRSLTYSAAEATSILKRNKRKMTKIPGLTGWELDSKPENTVVFESLTGTITHVETVSTYAPAAGPAPAAAGAAASSSAQ